MPVRRSGAATNGALGTAGDRMRVLSAGRERRPGVWRTAGQAAAHVLWLLSCLGVIWVAGFSVFYLVWQLW